MGKNVSVPDKEKGLAVPKKRVISGILIAYIIILALLLLLPLAVKSVYYLHILIIMFIFIIATASLRLIATSGQLTMGHAAMMMVGGYTSAVLALSLKITPWLTIPMGAIAGLVLGGLIGIPFMRLRGIYFSMLTLFFGIALINLNQVFPAITGGANGLLGIPYLFPGADKVPYYYCYLIVCVVSLLVMWRMEFSRQGTIWKGIAQSYSVTSSIGINEMRQRILVFSIGSFFAALAGALYAHYLAVLSLDNYGMLASINMIIYMLVGGAGSFNGPILGAAVLTTFPAIFREIKQYVPYINVTIMLLVIFFLPEGLVSLPRAIRQRFSVNRNVDKFKEEIRRASGS